MDFLEGAYTFTDLSLYCGYMYVFVAHFHQILSLSFLSYGEVETKMIFVSKMVKSLKLVSMLRQACTVKKNLDFYPGRT